MLHYQMFKRHGSEMVVTVTGASIEVGEFASAQKGSQATTMHACLLAAQLELQSSRASAELCEVCPGRVLCTRGHL